MRSVHSSSEDIRVHTRTPTPRHTNCKPAHPSLRCLPQRRACDCKNCRAGRGICNSRRDSWQRVGSWSHPLAAEAPGFLCTQDIINSHTFASHEPSTEVSIVETDKDPRPYKVQNFNYLFTAGEMFTQGRYNRYLGDKRKSNYMAAASLTPRELQM